MDIPIDLQQHIIEELQSDNVIVFVMSCGGEYLSLLGGSNRALYSDGSFLIGKHYSEVLKEKKAKYFQSLIDKVVSTGSALEVEYELATSDFFSTLPGGPEALQNFHVTILPYRRVKSDPLDKILWIVRNITK
ncbi:MAG: hypothetical protein B6241_02055 [Spirochaetaceae bacterium 4572_59]|nr:MAG: hypothetical protein B6241_02055 [Spirochaetaceae bacterium 4572_59]